MQQIPYETHVQWPMFFGFPDGVVSIAQFRECLEKARGIGKAIYRGEHCFYTKHVFPSCFREGSEWPLKREGSNLTKAEYWEIRKFQLRRPWHIVHSGLNRPTWIGLTQHYGGKTRLVDVTHDELVGLFFACWDFTNPPANTNQNGWVYVFAEKTFRPMSVPRTEVEKRSIEQGMSDDFRDFFDASYASPLYENIGHLYTPKGDRRVNARMSAQRGAFFWWHPAFNKFPAQIIPIPINREAKPLILKELDRNGLSVEVLFPDAFGRKQKDREDSNAPQPLT